MADLVPVNPENTPKYGNAYTPLRLGKAFGDIVNQQPGSHQWYFNDGLDQEGRPGISEEDSLGAIHPDALMQSRGRGAFTYPSNIDKNTYDQQGTDNISGFNMGIKQRPLGLPAPNWQFQARADDPQAIARALMGPRNA